MNVKNDSKSISVMARVIIAHDYGSKNWGRGGFGDNLKTIINKSIPAFVKNNEKGIAEAMKFALNNAHDDGAVLSKPKAAALFYLMKREGYSEECFEFLSQACSGVGASQNSMAKEVREKAISAMPLSSSTTWKHNTYMVVQCANSINAGRVTPYNDTPFIGKTGEDK